MRRRSTTAVGGVVLSALVLAGCGSSANSSSGPLASLPKITVKSTAIDGTSIPALYTCDGKNTSPPLEWGAVPATTGSLVLFLVGFAPRPGTNSYKLSIEWAVAGLNPQLHKLSAGEIPHGAFVGASTDGRRGYSICPAKGVTEHYQFELYGLPGRDTISPKFAGAPILGALVARDRPSPANAHGGFIATYKRT
jgi:phosphatidylethanolamine-binding protein (PEBP) family uncharacterized protein